MTCPKSQAKIFHMRIFVLVLILSLLSSFQLKAVSSAVPLTSSFQEDLHDHSHVVDSSLLSALNVLFFGFINHSHGHESDSSPTSHEHAHNHLSINNHSLSDSMPYFFPYELRIILSVKNLSQFVWLYKSPALSNIFRPPIA